EAQPKPEGQVLQVPFGTERVLLRSVHADLQRIHECRRPYTRYFVFRHTYLDAKRVRLTVNNGALCLRAIYKLANSLSWMPDAPPLPEANPVGAFVCRFDLRDFQWDAKTWDLILSHYPYAVEVDDPAAKAVSDMTGCKLPYVRGDWFVFAASRPPLYHEILR